MQIDAETEQQVLYASVTGDIANALPTPTNAFDASGTSSFTNTVTQGIISSNDEMVWHLLHSSLPALL
jgi:hypothetical protein